MEDGRFSRREVALTRRSSAEGCLKNRRRPRSPGGREARTEGQRRPCPEHDPERRRERRVVRHRITGVLRSRITDATARIGSARTEARCRLRARDDPARVPPGQGPRRHQCRRVARAADHAPSLRGYTAAGDRPPPDRPGARDDTRRHPRATSRVTETARCDVPSSACSTAMPRLSRSAGAELLDSDGEQEAIGHSRSPPRGAGDSLHGHRLDGEQPRRGPEPRTTRTSSSTRLPEALDALRDRPCSADGYYVDATTTVARCRRAGSCDVIDPDPPSRST